MNEQQAKQVIFDTIVKHARGMTHKSQGTPNSYGPRCMYRAADGNRCFIGALIPDELYKSSLEGTYIGDVYAQLGIELENGVSFLGYLQAIHDHLGMDKWEQEFESFAKRNSLIYTAKNNE